jgi:hypothetical protein
VCVFECNTQAKKAKRHNKLLEVLVVVQGNVKEVFKPHELVYAADDKGWAKEKKRVREGRFASTQGMGYYEA